MKTLTSLLMLTIGVIPSLVPATAHATCQSQDCRVELVDADCQITGKFAPEEQRVLSTTEPVTFLAYCMRYCYPPDGSPGNESLDYQPPADVLTVKDAQGSTIATAITKTERTCNDLPVFSATSLPAGSLRLWFPGSEQGTGGGLAITMTSEPTQDSTKTQKTSRVPETGEAPTPQLESRERSGACSASPSSPPTPASALPLLLIGLVVCLRHPHDEEPHHAV